ncbi:MAG TPA: hypothetical protein VMU22_02635 [Rhizomicrobium sp.]|nr:hypothetical protein [Rhizomicrobium sp.]
MADSKGSAERDAVRNRAQSHFQAAEKRDVLVREEIARDRIATDAKTAKLRALRLAKEEEERIAAANAPKPEPRPSARKKNTTAR